MANSFENDQDAPEMETLASLAENLVYRLPGCTDLMIRKTLQEVYRDFCRRSCCLRVRRQFRLNAGQFCIPCPPNYCGEVDTVSCVRWNGRWLNDGFDYVVNSAPPVTVHLAQRFVPNEDCPVESLPHVEVEYVEIPHISNESAPRWFIQKYGEQLCSGVLARLMSMTGKAWTDVAQAQMELIRYENAVNENRVQYYAHNNTGSMRAIPNDELL